MGVEQMRNQRARALEQLKRQEMMRTPAKANCMNVDSYPMEEELIQGLDGHLYRFLSSNSPKTNRVHYEPTSTQAKDQTDDQELIHTNLTDIMENYEESKAKTPMKKHK